MAMDDTVAQNAGIQQQVNVDPPVQPDAVNQIAQLNIRQRANGMSDEVMQLQHLLEFRPDQQCITDQYEMDDKKLAEFLSGDGNVCLIESGSGTENFPELDSEELDKLLSSLESCGPSDETNMEDSFVPDEEQKPVMSMPAVGYTSHVDVDTGTLCLYSPSPHPTSLQPTAAIQSPVSPTGITGSLLQQLTIDNNARVEMAVSGSNRPIQLFQYTPIQVRHFCWCFFSTSYALWLVCQHCNHITVATYAELKRC